MMRKLLNVLYVTSPDAYLACDNHNVAVRVAGEVKVRLPIHTLEGIVAFGHCGASPALMALCAESGVALTFLNEHGRFMARVVGRVSGNVLLRRKQYRFADSEEQTRQIATNFVVGKISNSRTVLLRAVRDHEESMQSGAVSAGAAELGDRMRLAENCRTLDDLRGVEGSAASVYFGAFDHLILANKDEFYLRDRNRRPPRDNMNAILSFLYSLLAHDVQSALETVGLDPRLTSSIAIGQGAPALRLISWRNCVQFSRTDWR